MLHPKLLRRNALLWLLLLLCFCFALLCAFSLSYRTLSLAKYFLTY